MCSEEGHRLQGRAHCLGDGCVQHLGVLTEGEYNEAENSYCQFFVEGSDCATCDGHRIDFPTLSSLFGNLTVLKPSE